jgi:hypothetical protein
VDGPVVVALAIHRHGSLSSTSRAQVLLRTIGII